jgi:hypothetical protein
VVFDSEVIYHQRKDDVTRDVTEETGGGGLMKTVGGKSRWERRRSWDSLLASFNPYIVLSMRKRRYGLLEGSDLTKRSDFTMGWVGILINWGWERGVPR